MLLELVSFVRLSWLTCNCTLFSLNPHKSFGFSEQFSVRFARQSWRASRQFRLVFAAAVSGFPWSATHNEMYCTVILLALREHGNFFKEKGFRNNVKMSMKIEVFAFLCYIIVHLLLYYKDLNRQLRRSTSSCIKVTTLAARLGNRRREYD